MANGTPLSDLNLIDVFGYLVPGALLVAGVVAAVDVDTSLFATASLVDLTLVGMFAFVVGMVLPGLEEQSWFVGVRKRFRMLLSKAGLDTVFSPHVLRTLDAAYEGHSFPQDLFEAQRRESPSSTRSPTTPLGLLDRFRASDERGVAGRQEGAVDPEYFDHEVLTLCRREFGLPDRLSRRSYDTVWLSVLSYLETTAHSRAFRMQALFEFSKNMLIVSELLSVYYLMLLATGGLNRALGVVLDVFPVSIPIRTLPVLVGLAFVSVAFMDVFVRLSTRFLSQWHLYSKMEFYVARTLNG